jgi:hypothetical protein
LAFSLANESDVCPRFRKFSLPDSRFSPEFSRRWCDDRDYFAAVAEILEKPVSIIKRIAGMMGTCINASSAADTEFMVNFDG